jgi:hypothetical protein
MTIQVQTPGGSPAAATTQQLANLRRDLAAPPKAINGNYTILATDDSLDFTSNSPSTVTVPAGLPISMSLAYTNTGSGLVTFDVSAVTCPNTSGASTAPSGTSGALVGTSTVNVLRLLNGVPGAGAVGSYKGAVANQAAMLAVTGIVGDWVTRTDQGGIRWDLTATPATNLASWTPAAPVSSGGTSLPVATAFSSTIKLDAYRMTPPTQLAAALAFTLDSTGIVDGGRWDTAYIGDGSHTPTAAPFKRRGTVDLGTTLNQKYLVQFQRYSGEVYYNVQLAEIVSTAPTYADDLSTATAAQTLQTFSGWTKNAAASVTGAGNATFTSSKRLTGSQSGTQPASIVYQRGTVATPGTGGVYAEGKMTPMATLTGLTAGAKLRANDAATQNHIAFAYGPGGFSITKRIGTSTNTVLATDAGLKTTNVEFKWRLEVEPNLQRLYIDDVLLLTGTDPLTDVNLGTEVGLRWSNSGVQWTDTTGPQISSYVNFGTYLPHA